MNLPENLVYTATHEWVRFLDDGTAEIGITDFAQSELGDIVFVELPSEGDPVIAGERLADVESVKAVSDVFCPVSGTVAQLNDAVIDSPESINGRPYDSWLVRVKDVTKKVPLLTAAEYAKIAGSREGA